MFKNLLIPTAENNYNPLFSSKSVLIIFTLWIFVFNLVTSFLITNHQVLADNLTADRIIELTNIERSRRELQTLNSNAALTSAAYAKANNMFKEQYWDHFGPNGETPWQFIKASGYEYAYAGENLGKGFTTSDALHQAWMASVTHRDNIINEYYTDIGIAIVRGNLENKNVVLVVQMFGRPAEVDIVLENPQYVQGEDQNGYIKSIRIVYPNEGISYPDVNIPIKGVVENIDEGTSVQILSDTNVLGSVKTLNDNTWEFKQTYDWRQGRHDIKAIVSNQIQDSVVFFIDSIPPKLLNLEVNLLDEEYILNIQVDKYPSEGSLISGQDIKNFSFENDTAQVTLSKDDITEKVFLLLSDDLGNINEIEITKYFSEEQSSFSSFFNFFSSASGIQKIVTIFFAIFILVILVVQVYHYKKLGMLKEREGDFLMLGLWWLILLFGSFIGYSGTIT